MPSPLLALGIIAGVSLSFLLYWEVVQPALEQLREEKRREEELRYPATAARQSEARTSCKQAESHAGEMRQRRRSSRSSELPLVDLMAASMRNGLPSAAADDADAVFDETRRPVGSVDGSNPESTMQAPVMQSHGGSPSLSALSDTLSGLEELDGVQSVRSLSDQGSAGFITVDDVYEGSSGSWSELGCESSDEERAPRSLASYRASVQQRI